MLAVVVEVQLHRDPRKRLSWPVYVTTLRARLSCPTALLVVCVDPAVATWAAAPIDMGPPGSRVVPIVLGPDRVPVPTLEQARQNPELAVLAAMAHGGKPPFRELLGALLTALESTDQDHALLYLEVVLSSLPTAAAAYLEELMTTETPRYQSAFTRRHFDSGKAEGKAEAKIADVLAVLDARGVALGDEASARITGCGDLDVLDRWLRRAATAQTVDDLFG